MDINKPKILCVDDNPANLKLLEAMLKTKDYEVFQALNGIDSIKILSREKVDLILLDIMMPHMNGYEVCKLVKESEKLRNIPVVMITSLNDKDERVKGIEAGAEDYISKPINKAEVMARVKALLETKELNDNLNQAYHDIIDLTSFGEEIITTFDPVNFYLSEKIDKIVSLLIRDREVNIEKPLGMIVGIQGDSYHIHYNFLTGKLHREKLNPGLQATLKNFENNFPKVFYFNNIPEEGLELYDFINNLKTESVFISNIAGYINKEIYIFAINYGRLITKYDAQVLKNMVMQSLFIKSLVEYIKEVDSSFEYTVFALARAAEANDDNTFNHILRVGEYSAVIAGELGMDYEFIKNIKLFSILHDVGKIHIHPDILKKSDELTEQEWEIVKMHTIFGAKILGEHPRFLMAKNIARYHHEKWDGSGYPQGLKGQKIPIEARIVNIADVYDALRSPRPYKQAYSRDKTFEIITKGDDRTLTEHFDPEILEVFKSLEEENKLNEIYERLTSLSFY